MTKNPIRHAFVLFTLARCALVAAMSGGAALTLAAFATLTYADQTQAIPDAVNSEVAIDLYDGSRLMLRRDGSGGGLATIQKTGGEPIEATNNQPSARSNFAYSVLADGSVLLSGGLDAAGNPRNTLEVFAPPSTAFKALEVTLTQARFDHASALLTDSRVAIIGGVNASGDLVNGIEFFDPIAGVVDGGPTLINARRNPTARLLPTGAVLIHGGTDAIGMAVIQDELLDPRTGSVSAYTESLRQENEALFDSTAPAIVEIIPPYEARGVDLWESAAIRFSRSPKSGTVNSSTLSLFGPTGTVSASVVSAQDGMLAFVNPTQNLQPGSRYSLFVQGLEDAAGISIPFTVSSFETKSIVKSPVAPPVNPVIVSPVYSDDPRYVHPLAHLTWPVPSASTDPEIWTPDQDALTTGRWVDKRNVAKRALQPLPSLPDGITAISGQVRRLDGEPLGDVTLKLGGVQARTDHDGGFLLRGVPSGSGVLEVNGATADHDDTQYGRYLVHVNPAEGKTTELNYTIWMPKIDPRGTLKISSPTTEETIVTTPSIPGLEVHIPAGTVIRDLDGKIVTEVNITAIPVNRPPFPLPDLGIPVYFSIQPGGAWLQGVDLQSAKGAQVYYPNYHKSLPGERAAFYNYDPRDREWFVYGEGATNSSGTQVVPDAGVAIYQFTGAMFNSSPPGPPAGPNPGNGPGPGNAGPGPGGNGPGFGGPYGPFDGGPGPGSGGPSSSGKGLSSGGPNSDGAAEPVSVSTGYFSRTESDLFLADVAPIELTRTYRSQDTSPRTFGIGWVANYDTILYSQQQWQEVDVILADGGRAHFARISAGTSYTDAIFESTTPGVWYKAQVQRNNPRVGWDLIFRDGTKWFFPQFQPLTEIVDPNGNTTTIIRRDDNGLSGPIMRIESPNGRYIDFTLDSAGRVTQAKDNIGRTYTYSYDATGRLTKVVDPLSHEHNYTYDTSNRLLTYQNGRGVIAVANEYDASGRVTRQTLADGNTFQFSYTLVSGKIASTNVTDQRGNIRHVEFSLNGYITKSVAAYGTAHAQETNFQLDTSGQITSTTDALGRVTGITYDTFGNRLSITRLQGTSNAATTNYTNTADGAHLALITDPLGHATSFSYDSRGNLASARDGLSHTATFSWDAQGRILTKTDPLNHVWTYAYSGPDLVSITDPLSRTTQFVTDAIGRIAGVRDASGQLTIREFDQRSRVTKITDAMGGVVQLAYDANGNLTSHTDQDNNTTSYSYNNSDVASGKTDALVHSESYVYGQNGLLSQITDRKGQVSGISYDDLNRVSQVGYGATISSPTTYLSTIGYVYDTGNRATQIIDSQGGTISKTFDDLDRMTQELTPEGSVSYTYDAAGRRATMTVAGQAAATYTWDNADRLSQVSQGGETVTFAYDAANRRISTTLGNGVVVVYGYDSANQLTSITYSKGSTIIGDLSYAYDLAGRRTSMGGSLAALNLPAAATSAAVNANNQVTSWAGTTLSYELNGNLTSDGTNTYAWNSRNELASISGASTASFVYDGVGRRKSKTIGGTQTGLLYDGNNFVQELNGASVTANFITGGIDELFVRKDAASASYPLADGLGSIIGLADGLGVLQTQYSYEPYGKATQSGAPSANSQQFTSREDDGTGLLYYRARYYNPTLGRFISEDPAGILANPNDYVYASGNPTRFIDPFGLASLIGGVTFSRIIGGGLDGSIGGYLASGDIGGFVSTGVGGGFNVGASAFAGIVFGDGSNINSPFNNINFSTGLISVTLMFDPKTGDPGGFTIGSGGRAGVSATYSDTGKAGLRGAFDALFDYLGKGRLSCP